MKRLSYCIAAAVLVLASVSSCQGKKQSAESQDASAEKTATYMSADLKTFHLLGKVKRCSSNYAPAMDFDEAGRITSMSGILIDYEGNSDSQGAIYYGVKEPGAKSGNFKPGSSNELLVRDDKGRLTNLGGGEIYEFHYDDNGFVVRKETMEGPQNRIEEYKEFDEERNPLKAVSISVDDLGTYKGEITYTYTKKDEAGNWIERTAHKTGVYEDYSSSKSKEDITVTETRTIEYY